MAKLPTAYKSSTFEIGNDPRVLWDEVEVPPNKYKKSDFEKVFCPYCGWRVFARKESYYVHPRKRENEVIDVPFCSLDIKISTKDGELNQDQEKIFKVNDKIVNADLRNRNNNQPRGHEKNPNPDPRGLPRNIGSIETLAEGLWGYYDKAVKFSGEETAKVIRKLLRPINKTEESGLKYLWFGRIDYCSEWESETGNTYITAYIIDAKKIAKFTFPKGIADRRFINSKKKGRYILAYEKMEKTENGYNVYISDIINVSLVPDRNIKFLFQNNDD